MKKIYLFCSAGMSTSFLVSKMKKAADERNYECEIVAHPVGEVENFGKDADIILLGPQVKYELNRVKDLFPNKIVECIDMRAYGMVDGEAVLKQVIDKIN